ncbi:cytochrome o ubiquinol oxidase subunit III [Marinomonas hwangdonensis]|uniref:Cytochrome bo(3) ubiquinol oxidase subunit 3 n=1 Tax=Marinomonas hwangdonensis TaxID=1053647 RepID=A0A3M8Q7G3_9GAMM|nr:cytochrome o ubiquinol oxidase subunit III [Marinomonas hwangdonensis]RNF51621.1 cytochrome o ubiquinol oxidase subunit III [Marinomonas hwangdonensis]
MSTTHMNTHDAHAEHEEHHDTGKDTIFGFWLYLMTDCLLFASVFATYAVLFMNSAGGVTAKEVFEPTLSLILVGTSALLISSITFGFAMISAHKKQQANTLLWLAATFIFGAVFIALEIYEFHHLISAGNGPQTSAFLSAFFTLVGLHGLHVTAGLFWMIVLVIEIIKTGLTGRVLTRLGCLSLFWHFLDIIWICVFTVVYLMGAI